MSINIDKTLAVTKSFKVYNSSILFMDDMKNIIISQANLLINNLSSELPKILSYGAGNVNVIYDEKLKGYLEPFGDGAIQALTLDAIFYSVSNFGKFLSFLKDFSFQYSTHPEYKTITTTTELRNELNLLNDDIIKRTGCKMSRTILLSYMLEFLIKEKNPYVDYAILPTEVTYLSYKIKNERNSISKGYKRRLMKYIYAKIIVQMIKGLYNKDLTLKDDVEINLSTDDNEVSKESKAFKEAEIRSREELNDMLVAGRDEDKPKPKFDLSLLNEEEQTMREALNGFMIPYGNRYVYEEEADFIVDLLNKVASNSVSLQQLKAALV